MDGPTPPSLKVWKPLCDDGALLPDDYYSYMSEDSAQYYEEDLTEVLSRRAKCLFKKGASRTSTSTVTYPVTSESLTVVFVPVDQTSSMGIIRKLKHSSYLSSIAPTEINEGHTNRRKKLIAVDADNSFALDKLLRVTSVYDISM